MNLLNEIKNNPNEFIGFEILIFLWYFVSAFVYHFIGKNLSLTSFMATLTVLIVMTAMGFIIPQKPLPKKIYLLVELFILFLPYISKTFVNLPFLGVFVLLRSYQMFGIKIVKPSVIILTLFILISTVATRSFLTDAFKYNNNIDYMILVKTNYIFWIVNIMILVNYMISNSESKKKLVIALDQVKKYSIQIEEQAIEIERGRIRRDIHDSIGYSLTATHLQLENGLKLIEKSQYQKAREFVIIARDLARESLIDLRSIINNINNDYQLELSLEKAIIKLIKDFQKSTAIEPRLSISIKEQLPLTIKSTVFRIIQESLSNIARHSKANDVGILLFIKDDKLNLIVEDNGIGFVLNDFSDRFGLRGIKERVNNLKGDLEIITQLGKGCHILVEIPL